MKKDKNNIRMYMKTIYKRISTAREGLRERARARGVPLIDSEPHLYSPRLRLPFLLKVPADIISAGGKTT